MTEQYKISVPCYLTAQHELEDFQSGQNTLDSWLRERALDNMQMGATRTYVVCVLDSYKVIEYYALYGAHSESRCHGFHAS